MKKYLIGIVIIALVVGGYLWLKGQETPPQVVDLGASTAVGYTFSTTTVSALQDPTLLKTGSGVLGRIVIGTPSATGTYICYNATTTDDSLRTVSVATSTIQLATIEAAPENGFLDYGLSFDVGLICDEAAGFDGIYTILWD